ncbi:hypothetical protein SAY86_005163 [Trapa natans]|uniref:Myb-like domain-containing protein n=1 Tax=Trapa natans TaxID=22666 RepID=A0AAN7L0J5_TRANT|nr:hypothetical protein SAY86_005163 [Trapa natans]
MLGGGGGRSNGIAEVGRPSLLGSGGAENEEVGLGGDGEERGGGVFGGGNRWPKQETEALLRIRTDMDTAFRDSSSKGPLWEEVSRKLADLGYHRSAKKCKEKFENVYKYHKRTREGRCGKQDGKAYRFFDQLEAFDNHPTGHHIASAPPPPPRFTVSPPPGLLFTTPAVPLATASPAKYLSSTLQLPISNLTTALNPSNPNFPSAVSKDLHSNYTSSSTNSDEGIRGSGGGGNDQRKRKMKWKNFFERLMKEVMDKQHELQSKFLEAIDKHEHERLVREESRRMQEMTRINREWEILAQERSMAAAKDTAVMSFLQKIADQQPARNADNIVLSVSNPPPPAAEPPPLQPPHQPQVQPHPVILPVQAAAALSPPANIEFRKSDNGGDGFILPPSLATSSRWPKVEVEALIRLRTNLDSKYQENVPKGPLWEEVSTQMRKLGYERSAKRCKEKWENMNKYFKKVKESNKKRPEDSKTCSYFQSLDAIYKERTSKIMDMTKLMVTREQQWPPQKDHHQSQQNPTIEDMDSEQMDHSMDDEHGSDDEEDEGGEFDVVAASKPSTNGNTQ